MAVTEVAIALAASSVSNLVMQPYGTPVVTVLSDSSDTTYARQYKAGIFHNVISLANYTVPAGKFVAGWKLRCRYQGSAGGLQYYLTHRMLVPRGDQLIPTDFNTASLVKTWSDIFAPQTDNLAGISPLMPNIASGPGAVLDRMSISFDSLINLYGDYFLFELMPYYEVVDMPTITVPAPTGSITNSLTPAVQATFSQPDGYAPGKCRVKIFTSAVYSGGGFNPETSTPVWDSGDSTSVLALTQGGLVPTVNMPQNTTLKAYVKMAITSTGSDIWTPWASGSSFVIAVEVPAQPSGISATADITNARMNVIVKGALNLLTVDDSTLEPSIGSWAAGANTVVSRSSAFTDELAQVLRLHSSGAGTVEADSGFYAVAPNTVYSAICDARSGGTSRTTRLRITWYTAALAVISTSQATTTNGASSFTTISLLNQTAPANAAWCKVNLFVDSTASGEDNYFDKIGLFPGATIPGGWTRGGFLSNAPSGITPAYWSVERSFDSGLTWEAVTIPSGQTNVEATQQVLNMYDYTLPWGVDVLYRAHIVGFDYNVGSVLTSSTLSMVVASQLPLQANGGFWLKDPLNASYNIAVDIMNSTFKYQSVEQQAVYYSLGRKDPIVVSDVINLKTFPGVMFETIDELPMQALEALHQQQATMLLQDSKTGLQWYVRFSSPFATEEFNTTPRQRATTVDLIEVAAP